MNFIFWFFVICAVVFLWVLLGFAYRQIGGAVYKIFNNIRNIFSVKPEQQNEEKEGSPYES